MRYLPSLPRKYKGFAAVGLAALALCVFSAIFGSRGLVDLRRMERQQAEAEAVAYELAAENHRLRDHIERLDSDDAYLEKLARERLGWIKPGEIVYRVDRRATSEAR
jgi:cell division protein FtsB